jgi:hypothetical protein
MVAGGTVRQRTRDCKLLLFCPKSCEAPRPANHKLPVGRKFWPEHFAHFTVKAPAINLAANQETSGLSA